MSRLDLLWTIKFQDEKHEVETVSTISRLLLENILPKHVAEIIIKENMSQVIKFIESMYLTLRVYSRTDILVKITKN